MERIRAILGATKIDLPVDINDPYDLGLLLRHLRHHSNLLANIGDPRGPQPSPLRNAGRGGGGRTGRYQRVCATTSSITLIRTKPPRRTAVRVRSAVTRVWRRPGCGRNREWAGQMVWVDTLGMGGARGMGGVGGMGHAGDITTTLRARDLVNKVSDTMHPPSRDKL